jgi:hypothetical protein
MQDDFVRCFHHSVPNPAASEAITTIGTLIGCSNDLESLKRGLWKRPSRALSHLTKTPGAFTTLSGRLLLPSGLADGFSRQVVLLRLTKEWRHIIGEQSNSVPRTGAPPEQPRLGLPVDLAIQILTGKASQSETAKKSD